MHQDIECELFAQAEKFLGQHQMTGGRNRKKFGKPLNQTENDRL
jgi:hypothetical protein